MQSEIDLKFQSVIPHDRVFINGSQSRCDASVSWAIRDVNNFNTRFSNLLLVTHPSIQSFSEWHFRKEGSGLVPLKVFLTESDKTARVIF